MTNEEANFIMHAGKKGMRWGVRKQSPRTQSVLAARKTAMGPILPKKGNLLGRSPDQLNVRNLKKSGASKSDIYAAKKKRDENWVEANKILGRDVAAALAIGIGAVTISSIMEKKLG